jgi:F-type H+-transporting ATPase subunit gamma
MIAASENAEEVIDDLTRSYNRARQEAITKELLEVVSGSEALAT